MEGVRGPLLSDVKIREFAGLAASLRSPVKSTQDRSSESSDTGSETSQVGVFGAHIPESCCSDAKTCLLYNAFPRLDLLTSESTVGRGRTHTYIR